MVLRLALRAGVWLLFVLSLSLGSGDGRAAAVYQMAVGHQTGPTYSLGVGISSLIKVKTLPSAGIDLNSVITADSQASMEALRDDEVDFALVDIEAAGGPQDPTIRAVATLRRYDRGSTALFARSDIDDDAVYQIIMAIFENIPFLASIDASVAELSLDQALLGLTVPLHAGAKRYFMDHWVIAPETAAQTAASEASSTEATSPAQATAAAAAPANAGSAAAGNGTPLEARSFAVYFGFDQDTVDAQGRETLRQALDFARGLAQAPAILVAGYTDSVGDADYNYFLAERRAKAVTDIIRAADLALSDLEIELFGERAPSQVTLDNTNNADNRRVEVFIETPVPKLQPLPVAAETPAPAATPRPAVAPVRPTRQEQPSTTAPAKVKSVM